MYRFALVLVLLCSPLLAAAAPVDPAVQAEAMAVYERWNKAVAAGKLKDGLPLRSSKARGMLAAEAKTPAAEKRVVGMLQGIAPERVEVLHAKLNRAGTELDVVTVASKTMPKGVKAPGAPPAGTKLQNEVTLQFVKEGGVWLFDTQIWGMDPAKVKPCASTAFDGMGAFNANSNTSMGGQIRRVAFNADHTLVVIRMFDEENCIFLPARAKLTELGLDVAQLEPFAIIEFAAWPHKTDKQRAWAESLKVLAEE